MSVGIIDGNCSAIYFAKVTINLPSVSAATSREVTVGIPGVKVGDYVLCTKPTLEAGLIFGTTRVSAIDEVLVTIANVTAGAIDEGSEDLTFLIVRPERGANSYAASIPAN